jgi:hypothetical protein
MAVTMAKFRVLIVAALETHRPCYSNVETVESIDDILYRLNVEGIRAPNDWTVDYTGAVTFRWYDGPGDHLSGSTCCLMMTIFKTSFTASGSLGDGTRRSYSSSDGFKIPGLAVESAVVIVRTLLEIVDAKHSKD